jgi:hypothetical protein
MAKIFKYELGCEAKDKVTGYKGMILSRAQWLTGCNTYGIKSQELKDGKPLDMVYFDEDAMDVIRTPNQIAKDIKKTAKESKKKKKQGGAEKPVYQTNK